VAETDAAETTTARLNKPLMANYEPMLPELEWNISRKVSRAQLKYLQRGNINKGMKVCPAREYGTVRYAKGRQGKSREKRYYVRAV
jgi:hypothetical protein